MPVLQFTESNAFIRNARSEDKKVLVHCQAGVSRSTTLCAAFLMEELDLTAEGTFLVVVPLSIISPHASLIYFIYTNSVEAVQKIADVRSIVCPAEFFMHQLELYERCNMELDASKYPEYRRFLMNYNAQDMLGERQDLDSGLYFLVLTELISRKMVMAWIGSS